MLITKGFYFCIKYFFKNVVHVVQKHVPLKQRFSTEFMHLLLTENLGKKYISDVVWETNVGKIYERKMNFCLRPKKINTSHCGESALNHTFKMLLRKVLSQISHSGVLLNVF